MADGQPPTPPQLSQPPEPHQPAPPLHQGESQWILRELDAMRQSIEKLDARFEKIDERLRGIENSLSHYKGWIAAGFFALGILQIVLQFLNVSVEFGSVP